MGARAEVSDRCVASRDSHFLWAMSVSNHFEKAPPSLQPPETSTKSVGQDRYHHRSPNNAEGASSLSLPRSAAGRPTPNHHPAPQSADNSSLRPAQCSLLTSAQGLRSATKNRCICWPSTASSSFSSDPSAIRLRRAATAVERAARGTERQAPMFLLTLRGRSRELPTQWVLLHALSTWLQLLCLTFARPLSLSKCVEP